MPSGSHRSSGGSHRSGGSSRSSGGGSRSYGSSRSYGGGSHRSSYGGGGGYYGGGHHHHHGPRRMRFGRVYISTGSTSFISFFFPIVIFFIILTTLLFVAVSPSSDFKTKIEKDYAYYQNMITYAEANQDTHIKDATIKDIWYNEDAERWFFEYQIRYENPNQYGSEYLILEGETYCVYTDEQIFNFNIGDTIQVAVNSDPITSNTDSVPLDYKHKALTDDGEYLLELESEKSFYTIRTVFAIITGVMIAILVFTLVRSIKNGTKEATETSSTTSSTTTSTTTTAEKFCSYCGAQIQSGDRKCQICGAPVKK